MRWRARRAIMDLNPKRQLLKSFPGEGELTLRTEDILYAIEQNADELALVLFVGINYYTGQVFDMAAITKAAHQAGAYAGFDLAHAAGNVPLSCMIGMLILPAGVLINT